MQATARAQSGNMLQKPLLFRGYLASPIPLSARLSTVAVYPAYSLTHWPSQERLGLRFLIMTISRCSRLSAKMNGPAIREDFLDKLKRSNEVSISVTGRKTKKKFSTQVWFVLNGEKVMLVPMKGSESEWLKDLARDPQIELTVDEIAIPFRATIVRDSLKVERVLDEFRAKYKSIWSESYYSKHDVCVEVPV